jgi:hypothetical protein
MTGTATGCANDPGGPKCSATFPDPQGGAVLQCEPAGTVAAGGACTRVVDSSGNELAGVDNCIDGYCSALGVMTGRACARYCDAASATTRCTSAQACFSQATGTDGHDYGLCRKTCDPFGAQTQCPQNNTGAPGVTAQVCGWSTHVGNDYMAAFCDVTGGTVAAGGSCNPNTTPTPTDCVAGQICLGDNVCHALCDDMHACGANMMCNPGLFGTNDTCDTTTGMGCVHPCATATDTGCEQCDTTGGTCVLIVTTNDGKHGGWCVAMPDGGGLVRDVRSYNVRPLAWQKNLKGANK